MRMRLGFCLMLGALLFALSGFAIAAPTDTGYTPVPEVTVWTDNSLSTESAAPVGLSFANTDSQVSIDQPVQEVPADSNGSPVASIAGADSNATQPGQEVPARYSIG